MFTLAFWKAAAERAVKTFAQSLVGVFTVAVGAATGFAGINWGNVLQAALVAAGLSLLTSIVSSKVGEAGPSLGGETLTERVAAVEGRDTPGTSRPELVAGPAADVTEGAPVDVTPVQQYDSFGAPVSDTRCPDVRPGAGIAGARSRCNLTSGHDGSHSDERGYWGGI